MCTVSLIWNSLIFGKFLSNSKSYLNGLVIAFTTFRLSRSAVSSSFPVLATWFEIQILNDRQNRLPEISAQHRINLGWCTLKTRSWRTCDHPIQCRLLLFVMFVTLSQDCLFDTFCSPLKELYISLWSSNNWISIIEKFQNSNFYQFRID